MVLHSLISVISPFVHRDNVKQIEIDPIPFYPTEPGCDDEFYSWAVRRFTKLAAKGKADGYQYNEAGVEIAVFTLSQPEQMHLLTSARYLVIVRKYNSHQWM